jgi:hypothetical protein
LNSLEWRLCSTHFHFLPHHHLSLPSSGHYMVMCIWSMKWMSNVNWNFHSFHVLFRQDCPDLPSLPNTLTLPANSSVSSKCFFKAWKIHFQLLSAPWVAYFSLLWQKLWQALIYLLTWRHWACKTHWNIGCDSYNYSTIWSISCSEHLHHEKQIPRKWRSYNF